MKSSILTFLKNNALALSLATGFVGYIQFNKPDASPDSPLTIAAREYLEDLPKAYAEARDGVMARRIRTRDEVISFANARAAEPIANALLSAMSVGCDPKSKDGVITNPSVVASALDDVVKGLK